MLQISCESELERKQNQVILTENVRSNSPQLVAMHMLSTIAYVQQQCCKECNTDKG
jgi:hypothetical protein